MSIFPKKHEGPIDSFWHQKFGPVVGGIALFIVEVMQIVLISAAIIFPIRYFLIKPFYVKGASMEPNFYDHEYLVIDELTYRLREPVRGEIIVFRYPNDHTQFFIKRVIGLPGETVEIADGEIIVYNTEHPNGFVLSEDYIIDERTDGRKKITLVAEEYFVLGDNRDESLDSRIFGTVDKTEIIGRVWVRGLPVSRASVFSVPDYEK